MASLAFGVIAAIAQPSISAGPLRSVPSGWTYHEISREHYWRGEYQDHTLGVVVGFWIDSIDVVGSICEADPDWDEAVTTLNGVVVCEMECRDSFSYQVRQMQRVWPAFTPGDPHFGDVELDPPGAGRVSFIFIHGKIAWRFSGSFCNPKERARIIDLLTTSKLNPEVE